MDRNKFPPADSLALRAEDNRMAADTARQIVEGMVNTYVGNTDAARRNSAQPLTKLFLSP